MISNETQPPLFSRILTCRTLTVFHPERCSSHPHRVSEESGRSESTLERMLHEELCNLHYPAG